MEARLLFFLCFATVVIFSHTIESTSTVNVCGGVRPIVNANRLGELCETGLKTDCPFGHFACASTEVLRCLPDCSLGLEDLRLELCEETPQEETSSLTCLNNGTLTCTCPYNYRGEGCEIYDPCLNVDCGNNGRCLDGQCSCNNLFFGERCEIHSGCTAKGFQWTGKTCKCAEGYTGPHCNQCDPTLICLPNNRTGDYVNVYIDDQMIIEEILASEKLPGYNMVPYRPNIRSALGCTCTSNFDASRQESSELVSNYADNDNLFVHHYYKATYRHSTSSSSYTWIWLSVVLIVAIGIAIAVCITLGSKLSWSNTGIVYDPSASSFRSSSSSSINGKRAGFTKPLLSIGGSGQR